ncbi:beta-galactosidase-like [Iris pallida]|uniref:Beta-galactosidase-like n=1 Tax=Iris pallida TaxID=29817 RepID=A0AAX6G1M9_IRIPA|nr:beta-galactosidase-like [Iris pallida]
MAKKRNQAEEQPAKLKWSWQSESFDESLKALGGKQTEERLLEQIRTSLDASDYLWYMTTFDNCENQTKVTLRVNTTGHVLHAFVNGKLIGSQYSSADPNFSFVFERPTELQGGRNFISLLSATVGLTNYGYQYELAPAGIVDGPVTLIGTKTYDLTKMPWSYKVGLDGLDKGLVFHSENWKSGKIPTKKPFTWYQTNFKAPLGSEPVVVDMLGMGKGEAFVNGRSIGRYWPSFIARKDGCGECDYRGHFSNGKCLTGCGEPSQRWYHVPRSFLTSGKPNVLTLFEEAGGNPSQVNFQTVVVGKICGNVPQGKTLTLSCKGYGRTIAAIDFASFGDPQGSCGSFEKGKCESKGAAPAVEKECLGKESCSLEAGDEFFGVDSDCGSNFNKRLAVQATCSGV